jgi:hypothetical protein
MSAMVSCCTKLKSAKGATFATEADTYECFSDAVVALGPVRHFDLDLQECILDPLALAAIVADVLNPFHPVVAHGISANTVTNAGKNWALVIQKSLYPLAQVGGT